MKTKDCQFNLNKMPKSMKCIYTIALIASLAASAYAINCYSCDNDSRCEYPHHYGSEFLTNCNYESAPSYLGLRDDPSATGCMEKTVKSVDGESLILRSCYWGDTNDHVKGCRNPPWATYTTLSCHVCSYSECNDNSFTANYGNYSSIKGDSYTRASGSTFTRSISVMIALLFAIMRLM